MLVLILTLGAAVQDTARLTLAGAVVRALATSPTLEAARQSRAGALGAVREARAQWFPQVGVEGTAFRYEEPMVVAPIHGFTPGLLPQFDETLIQGSAGLSWTLFDGGIRRGRNAQAEALRDASTARMDGAAQALVAAVVRTWAEVQARREAVAAEVRRGSSLRAEAERVARFLAEGRAAPLEQLRVNAALAGAEADRAAAEAAVSVSEAALARLVGLPVTSVQAERLEPIAPADPGFPGRDSLLALARAQSPTLQAAVSQAGAARGARRAAEGARFPSLRLEGRVVTYGSGAGDYSTEWQTGVRVSFPVYTGGSRGAVIDQARAAAAEADARVAEAELALGNRIDQVLARLSESGRRETALEAAVTQLTEAQRVEALALGQGAGTQSDFLRAEAELARARAGLAEARAARIAASVDLAQLTGRLSPATLAGIVVTQP